MEPEPEPRGSTWEHVRLFLTLFLVGGVAFGVFFGVLIGGSIAWMAGGAEALEETLALVPMAGLVFGAVMSLVLGTVEVLATRRQGPHALRVRQERRGPLDGTREEALERVAEAIAALPRAGKPRVDAVAGTVKARTRWSWPSFGEVVTARVEPYAPGGWTVVIESRPRLGTTLIDYGANAANADAVVANLTFD